MSKTKSTEKDGKSLQGKSFSFKAGKMTDGLVYVNKHTNEQVECKFIFMKNRDNRDNGSYLIRAKFDLEDFHRVVKEAKKRPLVVYHRSDSNRQPDVFSFLYGTGEKKPDGKTVYNSHYPYMLANFILNLPNGHWQKSTEFADGDGFNYCKDNILVREKGKRIKGSDYLKFHDPKIRNKKTILIKK